MRPFRRDDRGGRITCGGCLADVLVHVLHEFAHLADVGARGFGVPRGTAQPVGGRQGECGGVFLAAVAEEFLDAEGEAAEGLVVGVRRQIAAQTGGVRVLGPGVPDRGEYRGVLAVLIEMAEEDVDPRDQPWPSGVPVQPGHELLLAAEVVDDRCQRLDGLGGQIPVVGKKLGHFVGQRRLVLGAERARDEPADLQAVQGEPVGSGPLRAVRGAVPSAQQLTDALEERLVVHGTS